MNGLRKITEITAWDRKRAKESPRKREMTLRRGQILCQGIENKIVKNGRCWGYLPVVAWLALDDNDKLFVFRFLKKQLKRF